MTYNGYANHPLQSFEWGEFRKKTGVKVVRTDTYQVTIHPIPHLPWTIGYFPKGPLLNEKMIAELKEIGKNEHCIFIQLEPNVIKDDSPNILISQYPNIYPSAHPLFTRYSFQLDLTESEDELLKNMHPKTRYNIKVAQKHGIEVIEDNSKRAFEEFIKLFQETTKRQKFYLHSKEYHRLQWQMLNHKISPSKLTSHLLIAKLRHLVLAAWILFVFKDTLYYPYGTSSRLHKEAMSSNLLMWEVIRFGKKLGLKKFDMWGALGPNPDKNDPWYGFHMFKKGYGGKLVEFIGSYDLVINPFLYELFKIGDKIRWLYLKMLR